MRKLSPNSAGILLLAGLSALLDGCLFEHKPTAFTPPPPQTVPRIPPGPPPALPAPPQVAMDLAGMVPPDIPTYIPELAAPPAPKPPQQKKTATTPPRPSNPTPAESSAPPPRLGQVFTPEQERDYNRTIDESLDRVKRVLAALAQKHLNTEQTEAASRITNFQKQAEQYREVHDLASADLWAKRAAQLADDLLTRVP
jgi:hypothetical protein